VKPKQNRRTFLSDAGAAIAAGVATVTAEGAPAKPNDPGVDYYDKLGVTKIINAAGTYTILTASVMPASVQAAVARAAKTPAPGELLNWPECVGS
jgi:hypothetical protein